MSFLERRETEQTRENRITKIQINAVGGALNHNCSIGAEFARILGTISHVLHAGLSRWLSRSHVHSAAHGLWVRFELWHALVET